MKTVLALLLIAALARPALAQQASAPVASLQALSFLSGHWTGESEGDFQEEYWSPVYGNSMLGTFRVVHAGTPVFYEFWVIELDGGRPVYKLKHFNGGLQGWEDKNDVVALPVRELSLNHVLFSNGTGTLTLRYDRNGSKLTATLHHISHGKPSDEVFILHRAD